MISRVLVVAALLVLAMMGLVLLPFTGTGSRLAVELLDRHTDLTIEYGGGSLGGTLILAHVEVPTDDFIVTLSNASAKLLTRCLWRTEICLQGVRIDHLDIFVPTGEAAHTQEDEESSFWPLPFAVSSEDLALAELDVHWAGGTLRSERISGSFHVAGARVHVIRAEGHTTRLLVPGQTAAADADEWELPTVNLPLELLVDDMVLHDSSWQIDDLRHDYDELHVSGRWQGTRLAIASGLLSNPGWGRMTLTGDMTFEHPYPVQARSRFETTTPPPWAGLHGASGQLALEGGLDKLAIDLQFCGTVPFTVKGSVDSLAPSLPLSVVVTGGCGDTAQPIVLRNLPGLEESPDLRVAGNWSARIDGDSRQQALAVRAALSGYGYDGVELDLRGEQGDGAMEIADLQLRGGPAGQFLEAAGRVEFAEALSWDLGLVLAARDLTPVWPTLTGEIDGTLQAAGKLNGERWMLVLSDIDLAGALNDLPAAITGQLQLDEEWHLLGSQLEAVVNGAQIRMQARATHLPGADIRVADIGQWLGDASGGMTGSLRWDRAASRVEVQAVAEGLRIGPLTCPAVDLGGYYRYGEHSDVDLRASAAQLQLEEVALAGVTLALSGSPRRHSLRLRAAGDATIDLTVDGVLADGDWQGLLHPADLTVRESLWRLPDEVELNYDSAAALLSITGHCWQQADNTLCLDGARLGSTGSLDVELAADLHSLAASLPPAYDARGKMRGRLSARWDNLQVQNLSVSLEVGAGQLEEALLGGDMARLDWDRISLNYRGNRQSGQLQGVLRRQQTDRLRLDLNLPTAAEGLLSGSLTLEDIDLADIRPFFSQLSHLQGRVSGNLAFDGRVAQPGITGSIALGDGRLSPAGNPTQFENISLLANFLGKRAELRGDFRVGEGHNQLEGELTWLEQRHIQLTVAGDNNHFLYPTDTVIVAAENLRVDLTPRHISVQGEVNVSDGKIVLENQPEAAVELSDDVILVDSAGEPIQQARPTATEIALRIHIADRLKMQAEGLSGRLGGDLLLQRQPGKPLQLFGSVNVPEGRFELLGPRFDVTRGQISFVGPPDNPQLDIAMEREITQEQVTVGIQVRGTLEQPQLEFYSRPPLPEAEVMAYALGGRGIDRTGNTSGVALALAATSGYLQSEGLLKGVSLGVEGRDLKSRAVVGGQLSDRIYLSYGVGLYDPVTTLTVRLDLLRNLWMEVVSGLQNSTDLYYSWSR